LSIQLDYQSIANTILFCSIESKCWWNS